MHEGGAGPPSQVPYTLDTVHVVYPNSLPLDCTPCTLNP